MAPELAPAPSVRAALGEARARLRAAGCDSPGLDAELLLAHVLGTDRAGLVLGESDRLPPDAARAFEALVARRGRREPVAYLTGKRAFRFLELEVDPRVLIPRPETELLVEVALELPPGARVLDVGTGGGAVALALKHERADLEVVGSDVSVDALDVARANASRLGLDVPFARGDGLEGVAGRLDAVLGNLPYVAEGDRQRLAPEIADHEPARALFAGPDGLEVMRRVIAQAAARDVGFAALEVGARQARAVAGMLAASGYGAIEARRDLAGHERVVLARR